MAPKEKYSNDSGSTKKSQIKKRFYIELFIVALVVFCGMFLYELLKTYILPELTIWQSHIITIVFSTIVATSASYLILKRRNILAEELTQKSESYRLALEKLEVSEKKFQDVFNQANDMISLNYVEKDRPGNFIEVNKAGTKMLGYTREEFLKLTPMDIVAPEKRSEVPKNIRRLMEAGQNHYEIEFVTKEGEKIPVEINNRISYLKGKPASIAVTRDVTERKKAEDLIKQSLDEKDMLMKETHHRVKNNLMIISSLLNLQSQYIKDKESQEIFKESQNRARSMALIHERLYQSTDLKNVGLKEYITTLAHDLYRTYVCDPERVSMKLEIEDINLDINYTIPLGLILNELITNSMKYAFPDQHHGTIIIELSKKGDILKLKVSDDGIGFPTDIDYKNTTTLGLQLVNSLTQQIDGEIDLNTSHGTEFSIKFQEKKF